MQGNGDGGDTLHDARPVDARMPPPPRLAARYEMDALLGEGGMGEVHECRETRAKVLSRLVA